MQPTNTPTRANPWKRYGPLIAVLVVVLAVAAIVMVSSGGDDGEDATSGSTTTTEGANLAPGVMNWSTAQAQGLTDQIEWGARCDTERGQLAFPSYFAPECYAPFTGDNGGATGPGVTADSVKVVLYLTPETDPVIDFITSAVDSDDTNAQTEQTVRGFLEFYQSFYETYGRTYELGLRYNY